MTLGLILLTFGNLLKISYIKPALALSKTSNSLLAKSKTLLGKRIKYTGPFTNTTYNLDGNVTIEMLFEPNNKISGYINFTNYPGTRLLCGAGDFKGTRERDTIQFTFMSNDPETDCRGFDRGWSFTVNANISEDGTVLKNGSYQVEKIDKNRLDRGIFIANKTPCNDGELQTEYNRISPSYHFYKYTNEICSKTVKGCTKEKVFSTMISQKRFIAPTFDNNPVSNCEKSVLIPKNHIKTTINLNDFLVTNYTLNKHMFHPGKITRKVVDTGNSIAITTIGE
ncbi:MAG: hypothetical protein AAFW70_27920, partial [Cyanobacteria bacterium J06635_10]